MRSTLTDTQCRTVDLELYIAIGGSGDDQNQSPAPRRSPLKWVKKIARPLLLMNDIIGS